jgi:streptogramin lyase
MKYTHNGKVIVEFERSKQHMKYPRRIAENTNGDIYVSDHKESCVHVLNSDGRQKRKYNGTEGNLIGEPCGLTCDRYGHVLVTDYKNHCVHLLDQQSQHLCNILSEKDGIKNPFSVAVDGDGFLWLGCSLGMVHIFQFLL